MAVVTGEQNRVGQQFQTPLLGKAHTPIDVWTTFLDLRSVLSLGEVNRSWAHWVCFTKVMFHSEASPMNWAKRQFLRDLIKKKVFPAETVPPPRHFACQTENPTSCAKLLLVINQWPHLQTLRITGVFGSEPVDLSPLRAFTNLWCLTFTSFKITSLSPLSGLTELRMLNLSWCIGTTDLASLSNLTNLQRLDLTRHGDVTDLAPLTNLVALRALGLSRCKGITDLSPLSTLTGLQMLDLSDCTGVTDLTPLSSLTALRWLDLRKSLGITGLAPLKSLTALQRLDLDGLQISDDDRGWLKAKLLNKTP